MPARKRRLWAAALVALLAALTLPAGSGAGPSAADLKREQSELAATSRSALLELYALERELTDARARLAAVRARAAAVERERADVTRRLTHARTILHRSQLAVGARMRALYEVGDVDPLALVLGAESIDDALQGLDGLRYAAGQDAHIVDQARSARTHLTALSRKLEARSAEVKRLAAAAEERAAALTAARGERQAFLAQVAARQRLNAAQLSSLERRAAAAEARAQAVTEATATAAPVAAAAPASDPVAPTPTAAAPQAGRTLTVIASAYALRGRTATGISTGYGVVAVDPAVIPLGTRMTVPGYGSAVAADVGGAIRGARIDLWFPTVAQARAWGVRRVTITLG